MAWIKTLMKPVKLCIENPDYPVSWIFQNVSWELSGGTKQAGILTSAFILALDVDTVVEIGAWQGFSSFFLARSLVTNSREPLLLTVDINQRALNQAKAMSKDLPINHKTVEADSMGLDLSQHLEGRQAGLCFIDGNHTYEWCKNDLEICSKVLKTWGIMVVHDYSKAGFPGVYQAVNEFVEANNYPMFFQNEHREATDYRTAIIQKRGNY